MARYLPHDYQWMVFVSHCWRRTEKVSWSHHVRNEEVLFRVNEQRNILHEIRKRKANSIGHILRRNCLLQQVIEGKIKWQIEVTRRRERRRKKLLDDLKDRRGYCQFKEEALDRTMWRNRFGRGFGPVVWQITDDDDELFTCVSRHKCISILHGVYASFWNLPHATFLQWTHFLRVSSNPRIFLQRYSLRSSICLPPTDSCDGTTVGGRIRGAGDIEPSSGLSRKCVHHVQPEMKVGKFKIQSIWDSTQNIHKGDVQCSRLSVTLCQQSKPRLFDDFSSTLLKGHNVMHDYTA